MARKVMYILRYLSSEKISENEIVKIIGIPLGSVRGYCGSSLKKFIKNEEGYFLLNYKLKGFKDYLEAKKK